MMPYNSYRLYETERVKSPAEIRRAEEQEARMVAAVSSLFRELGRPVQAARRQYTAAARRVLRMA